MWLDRRFGSRRAVIQEKSVRRGAQFHFTFQQKFQVRTELISVGIFLVFRETLKRSPPWDFRRRQPVFDRLIGSFQGNSRTYEAGDALTENCSFEIPDRAMGVRNPFNKHGIKDLGWVLKIRLDLASENTVWREYRLELDGGHVNNEADHPPYQRFDVYLVGEGSVDYWGLNQVVNKALSHHVMPGGFLVFKSQEILLLERRTLVEAELLKDQLTALGAVVDIRPAV
ncbi:hypothetical protein EON80_09710 [bacterium]|nr:MAG: hypothetical protein EON80_09710 [bacterium]